jgi:hypothetical protein
MYSCDNWGVIRREAEAWLRMKAVDRYSLHNSEVN